MEAPDENVATTFQPAKLVSSTQWHVVVTGQSWECAGTMSITITDDSAVTGAWSCNYDLRFPYAQDGGHFYSGPITGTANGAVLTLAFGQTWNPALIYAGTVTMGAALAGTITVETGPATLAATKI